MERSRDDVLQCSCFENSLWLRLGRIRIPTMVEHWGYVLRMHSCPRHGLKRLLKIKARSISVGGGLRYLVSYP